MAGLYKDFKGTDSSLKTVLKKEGFTKKNYIGKDGDKFTGYSKPSPASKALSRKKEGPFSQKGSRKERIDRFTAHIDKGPKGFLGIGRKY